jgi:hypothetical protein
MLAGYQPNAFHHLETVRLGGNASSVEFTNLARYSDYQHLQIRFTARNTGASAGITDLRINLNSDSGLNYRSHRLFGDGSTVTSGDRSGDAFMRFFDSVALGGVTAGMFTAGVIDILDPYETKNKTLRALIGGAGVAEQNITLHSGLWVNTASLTTFQLSPALADFTQGSRFSLYGIKARA